MPEGNWFGFPGDVLPPNLLMLQLIIGKWVSQAVYVAAELGIADLLKDGPRASDDVARACSADADGVYRLMRALANIGVLEERDERTFALTEVGTPLRSDVPGTMRAFARFAGYEPTWRAWGELLHSVRTGEPGVQHVYGEDLFTWFAKHPTESAIFDDAMTSISSTEAMAVAGGYDFGGIGTLADVGGGRGMLLATILREHPAMRGVLFDMPHVVAGAPALLRDQGVADRVRIEEGSFFDRAPEGADAIIMKHIVHDWNDEDAIRILGRCHRALQRGSRVLVVEPVVPPPDQQGWGKLLDLEMLALTPRGRERTEREYAELFRRGGFELTRVVPTMSPVAVVEGRKV